MASAQAVSLWRLLLPLLLGDRTIAVAGAAAPAASAASPLNGDWSKGISSAGPAQAQQAEYPCWSWLTCSFSSCRTQTVRDRQMLQLSASLMGMTTDAIGQAWSLNDPVLKCPKSGRGQHGLVI